MSDIKIKSKHIIPAFIIFTFGNVIVFGFLRWLLCIQFSLIDINEEIWELWIPMLFPWVPILIWLRPRFRLLAFKDNDKGRFFPQIVSWLTMAAMLAISQSYITTATGKLEILNSVDEIFTKAPVRY